MYFSKSFLDACLKKPKAELHEALRSVYEADGYDTAVQVRDHIAGRFLASEPKAVEVLEEGFEDVTAVSSIPLSLRRRLKTTSDLERVK